MICLPVVPTKSNSHFGMKGTLSLLVRLLMQLGPPPSRTNSELQSIFSFKWVNHERIR